MVDIVTIPTGDYLSAREELNRLRRDNTALQERLAMAEGLLRRTQMGNWAFLGHDIEAFLAANEESQ